MKHNVPYKKVVEEINNGTKDYSIAKKLSIPISVVERIRKGKVIHSYNANPKLRGRIKIKPGMCSCCGIEPIMKGNRFLCLNCYSHNPVSTEQPHKIPTIEGAKTC